MSSIHYKPSRSPVTILAAPRHRWTQRELDDLAWDTCNKWCTPDIGQGKATDPQNSRLFVLISDALSRVNGD